MRERNAFHESRSAPWHKTLIFLPHGRGSEARSDYGASRSKRGPFPLAYFITFSTYGTWLHGEQDGSVDRKHNQPGTPFVPPEIRRVQDDRSRMDQPPYEMDNDRRSLLAAIREVCAHRGWCLRSAHVRSNHVHVVAQAQEVPERVMNDFKSYASRRLNVRKLDGPDRKRWTRHGSTQYLWKPQDIAAAMEYTINGQGEPMALYVNREPQASPSPSASSEPRPSGSGNETR